MDRKTGLTAALVLAGLFVPSYLGQSGPSPPPEPPAPAGSSQNEKAAKEIADTSPDPGPWTPVCKYFQTQESPGASTKDGSTHALRASKTGDVADIPTQFCVPTGDKDKQRTVIIATLPDPELTHLSMLFDRDIESITSAAADGDLATHRYSFNSYWFPWHPAAQEETDPAKRKAAEQEREKRESVPGILLFRERENPEHLLLVFLVGETPTSGVNRIAFLKAWKYREDLETDPPLPMCTDPSAHVPPRCAAILGPSFTGSLPSLKRLLAELKISAEPKISTGLKPLPKNQSVKQFPTTVIISGAVTGIQPGESVASLDPAHFCTTLETQTNRRAALEEYLGPERFKSFAELREDETLYGEGAESQSPAPNEPMVLRYPRGLSRIRNLSGQLPGLNTLAPQNSLYPELPLDLRDTGQDSIPSFGQQTPVSQEAVLFELVATLRREHKRYVGIVATDPLDALFLTRGIRALAPNVRIVIFHADQLFARAAATWGLRGIIAVTSYPLVSRNQSYSPTRRPHRTEFPDETAEGEYNALRRMFLQSHSIPASEVKEGVDPWCSETPNSADVAVDGDYLLDYTDPFAGSIQDKDDARRHEPSIWIDVLGHNAWWPAATLPAASSSPLLHGPDPAGHMHIFRVEDVIRIWLVFFWIVWTLCAAHVLLTLLMNAGYSSRLWTHTSLRVFGWGFRPDLIVRRYGLSCTGSFVVAATCVSLSLAARASGLTTQSGDKEFLAGMTMAAFSLIEAIWAIGRISKLLAAAGAAVSVLITVGAFVRVVKPGPDWHVSEFAGYRAVHLESGTSPIVPLVILLAILYLYCWSRQFLLRRAEDLHVTLPAPAKTGFWSTVIRPEHVVPRFSTSQSTALAAVIVCWFLFVKPPQALSTLENLPLYDGIVVTLSTSVVILLALTAFRLFASWRTLRRMLGQLERSPLRYAFSRLPKDFSWMAVWTGDPRPKLLMPTRALEVLRLIPESAKDIEDVEKEIIALDKGPSPEAYKHVEGLNEALDRAAVVVAAGLEPTWQEGMSDTIWSHKEKEDPPVWRSTDQVIGEEFLALRFVWFIRYALWIMRALLGFLTYGLILLVAALTLYPFEGEHEIGIALVIFFIVIGGIVFTVFAEMDRDPIFSRLSDTRPNELSWNFFYRILSFSALPLLTLLASQVPAVGNFLLSWLQPALAAIK